MEVTVISFRITHGEARSMEVTVISFRITHGCTFSFSEICCSCWRVVLADDSYFIRNFNQILVGVEGFNKTLQTPK